MTITEVGCMGVKPGLRITDPNTPEGAVLPGIWKTVLSQPGGPQNVIWGLEKEDPSKVWAFFDWDSVQQHEVFAKKYGVEAVKDIPKVCTHGEFTKHVALMPSNQALRSPSTRIIVGYFPSDISLGDKEAITQQVQGVLTERDDNSSGSICYSYGWGLETDYPVRGAGDGTTGSVFMVLIGEETEGEHKTAASRLAHAIRDMANSIGLHDFTLQTLQHERE
ncbi:unnamed protein product [Clonostachys byssicola]|uniref:ABM domain-containing protein n=1 Tax=Clonostachys byssicola TaxID=160290 RepID=A0A9N9UIM8_9HYPO|nr:unnamed protein product [Clonostachys byssicola]